MAVRESKRVLLGYSHQDRSFAGKLAASLRESGIDTWQEEWRLAVDGSAAHEIQEWLRRADFVVVPFSRYPEDSLWMPDAPGVDTTCRLEASSRAKILPVRLAGCELPRASGNHEAADFRHSYVIGLTKLLSIIVGSEGMTPLDQAFMKHADAVSRSLQAGDFAPIYNWPEVRTQVVARCLSRLASACSSAISLAWYVRSWRDQESWEITERHTVKRHFEHELGNTIRDFLEFTLYDGMLALLPSGATLDATDQSLLQPLLLDRLYSTLKENIRCFGWPAFRAVDESVTGDLDRIFSSLSSQLPSR
jgi:hypothetical protein